MDEQGKRRPLTKSDLVRMNVPKRFWEVTLSGITDRKGEEGLSLKDLVRRYLENFDAMVHRGAGLLLWGKNGLGKTGAAVVLAKECRRRQRSVLFMTAAEYLRSIHDKLWFDESMTFVDRARTVDVLVIDDFGKEHKDAKGWAERQFEDLIRTRSSDMKVTLFTMNVPMNRFVESSVPSMVQVLKECSYPFMVVGPDKREEKQAEIERVLVG